MNDLVASTLWHNFKVLSPPRSLVVDIQKLLVDFFLDGTALDPSSSTVSASGRRRARSGGYPVNNNVLQTANCPEAPLPMWSEVARYCGAASSENESSGV